MTILHFPSTPSPQAVLAALYRLAQRFPAWALELDVSEDGRPSVSAEHRKAGGILSAHWDRRGWAVVTEDGQVVALCPDLSEALGGALA